MHIFVPIGVVFTCTFCVAPPVVSFLLLWAVRQRSRLQGHPRRPKSLWGLLQRRYSYEGASGPEQDPLKDADVVRRYGFLYSRYR